MFSSMRVRILFIALLLTMLICAEGFSQCAMCRATLENNYSNGSPGIAAGINTGILYLLAMPYLAVMILGYLWFKSTKNARKNVSGSVTES
jgi:hypothetical protein